MNKIDTELEVVIAEDVSKDVESEENEAIVAELLCSKKEKKNEDSGGND